MDWAAIVVVVAVVLDKLASWIRGPYSSGHAEEKGKRLATHEDIENVTNQMRIITQATESKLKQTCPARRTNGGRSSNSK